MNLNPVIVTKKTSDLIEYDNNPRNNDAAVEAVANSIREFGFKVPIVIDKNNVIVAGHTRLKACKALPTHVDPMILQQLIKTSPLIFFLGTDKLYAFYCKYIGFIVKFVGIRIEV